MSELELLAEHALQVVASEGPVPSPCISVCRMDGEGALCLGCLRTLDEIAAWGTMDNVRRRAVWSRIADRAQASKEPE